MITFLIILCVVLYLLGGVLAHSVVKEGDHEASTGLLLVAAWPGVIVWAIFAVVYEEVRDWIKRPRYNERDE